MGDVVRVTLGVSLLIGAVGLAVWAFIQAVLAEPAVAGTVATAVGGVAAALYQQRGIEQVRLREAHRERMTPAYEGLLDKMWQQMLPGRNGEQVPQDMIEFMAELKGKQLLLGASSEMIQAFNDWGAAANTGESIRALLAWEDLLRAIRKDLGHDDAKLSQGDLLRLFVTDIDEHLNPAESRGSRLSRPGSAESTNR